jgi:hypothetical protein
LTDLATAMQLAMRAMAAREQPMSIFCGPDFLYQWTKEKARADAIDAARAALPRWTSWRRFKREGNRAYKKCVPDWKPVKATTVGQIDRTAMSWWKNKATGDE